MWGIDKTMSNMNKKEVTDALNKCGISFPSTATLVQLRKLLAEENNRRQEVGRMHDGILFDTGTGTNTGNLADVVVHASEDHSDDNDDEEFVDVPSDHIPGGSGVHAKNNKMAICDKEIEILRLKIELRRLESDHHVLNPSSKQYSFMDIENSVQKFTGDNSYGIEKWILDLEEMFTIMGCNNELMYIYARRLLEGTAKLYIYGPSTLIHMLH